MSDLAVPIRRSEDTRIHFMPDQYETICSELETIRTHLIDLVALQKLSKQECEYIKATVDLAFKRIDELDSQLEKQRENVDQSVKEVREYQLKNAWVSTLVTILVTAVITGMATHIVNFVK